MFLKLDRGRTLRVTPNAAYTNLLLTVSDSRDDLHCKIPLFRPEVEQLIGLLQTQLEALKMEIQVRDMSVEEKADRVEQGGE